MKAITPTGALRAWWSVFMVLVAALLVAGAGILYTAHTQRQADRRWCALLTSLDQPQAPATTERGAVIQRQIHKLRSDLECAR